MSSLIGPICSAQNLQLTVGCRLFQQVECAVHKTAFSECPVDKKTLFLLTFVWNDGHFSWKANRINRDQATYTYSGAVLQEFKGCWLCGNTFHLWGKKYLTIIWWPCSSCSTKNIMIFLHEGNINHESTTTANCASFQHFTPKQIETGQSRMKDFCLFFTCQDQDTNKLFARIPSNIT